MRFPSALLRGLAFGACLGPGLSAVPADARDGETVVFLRHAEKPALGLGQLDCQGLNRALALPPVLDKLFGKPDAIFAPDPSQQVQERGGSYDYIRPLATIEPTAVAYGLPVDAGIGVDQLEDLRQRLESPAYANALVFVAWEHALLVRVARRLVVDRGGDPTTVPSWPSDDYDSLYVLTLPPPGAATRAGFEKRQENLNGQPTACLHPVQ